MNKEMEINVNDCVEEIAADGKLSTKLAKVDLKKIGTIGLCAAAAAGVVAGTVVLVRKNKDKIGNLISKTRSKKRHATDDMDLEAIESEILSGKIS